MMQLDSTVTQPITKERKLVRTYVNRNKKARRGTEVSGQVGSCPVSEKYAYTEHGTIGEQNRETGIDPNLEEARGAKAGGEAGAGTSWCYMFIHNKDAAKFSEYAASEAGF